MKAQTNAYIVQITKPYILVLSDTVTLRLKGGPLAKGLGDRDVDC